MEKMSLRDLLGLDLGVSKVLMDWESFSGVRN